MEHPRSGAFGSWDRSVGPGASTTENLGSVASAVLGAVVAPRLSASGLTGRAARMLLGALALDLWGGAWCNNTPSCARWYERDGQTAWLAEHAEELRIPFVAHLGDIVDQVNQDGEWRTADRAMQTLDDADVPYSILAGNHDVRNSSDNVFDTDYTPSNEPYLQYFGPDRAAEQSTYGGSDPTGMNQYHVFEAEGQQFMVLALSWRASNATLEWADAVMAQHPTVPVILTTHELLNIEADGVSPRETGYGLRLWDDLIAENDQIFLTINGHFHGASRLVKQNDAGNDVTQLLMDYQMAYEGGNGYLRLLEFDLTNDRIAVQTPSPWVVSKPTDMLTSYDQAFLEGENNQFGLDVDFAERFAGFAPDFGPGTADEPSLTRRARDIVLDGFTQPEPVTTELPGSTADYPVVEGTLAHWRMNGATGALPEGGRIPDVAAGNDLTRVPIGQSGSTAALPGDVTVTQDANPFSSDGAAVCFTGSSKETNRFSYLTTAADAPVNDAALEGGYTIETFLKIDAGWTQSENAWMKAIVRSGNRSRIGVPQSRWDWTASPVALGLSNLREFQWTEIPIETTRGDRTSWSGEIILDRWVHVALVNDPADRTTTMYVDGAPVPAQCDRHPRARLGRGDALASAATGWTTARPTAGTAASARRAWSTVPSRPSSG